MLGCTCVSFPLFFTPLWVLPTGSVDNSSRPSLPPKLEVINSSSGLKMGVCRDFGVPIERYLRPDPHGRDLSTLPTISTRLDHNLSFLHPNRHQVSGTLIGMLIRSVIGNSSLFTFRSFRPN